MTPARPPAPPALPPAAPPVVPALAVPPPPAAPWPAVEPPVGLPDVPAVGLPVVPAVGLPLAPPCGLPDVPAVGLPDVPAVGLPVVPAVGLPLVPPFGLPDVPAVGLPVVPPSLPLPPAPEEPPPGPHAAIKKARQIPVIDRRVCRVRIVIACIPRTRGRIPPRGSRPRREPRTQLGRGGLALKVRGQAAERSWEVLRIAGAARCLLGLGLLSSWACGRIGYETFAGVTADAAPKVDAGTPGTGGTGGIPGTVGGRGGTTPPDAQGPMDANSDQVILPPSDAGILPDANAPDAPQDTAPQDAPQETAPLDTAACPAICNAGCAGGTCKMVDPGDGPFSCPPGMPCEIWCGDAQCGRGLVECGAATRCDVHCTGVSSCGYQVACGTGPCTVECSGSLSCAAVSCGSAPSCTVNCAATSSCWSTVLCAASKCDVRCGADMSCKGGVDCSTACACKTTCPPGGCSTGRWTHSCPMTSCQNADDSCNDTGAGCNTCP